MADVFIGYSRVERRIAQPLAATLEALGYTTWFDAALIAGVNFVSEIQSQVMGAKCIIVLWSERSVESEWVKAEAMIGLEQKTLVQISIDGTEPPLPFRNQQFLRMDPALESGALNDDPNFHRLVDAVASKVGRKRDDVAPDEAAWALAQAVRTTEAYKEFAERHPSSRFTPEARRRLQADGRAKQGKVFLSYRRDDTQAVARLLFERIGDKLGRENVFFDVDAIPLGVSFDEYIQERLLQCSSLLAIIGGTWLGKGSFGTRIKSSRDFVRKEIEMALNEKIRVIPVVVTPHPLPSEKDLPKSLRALPRIQAADLNLGRDYEQHVERIVAAVT